MELINLTPHAVTLHGELGSVTLPKGLGPFPRLETIRYPMAPVVVGGVILPVKCVVILGEVRDLPAPTEGVVFVVSAMVEAACPKRSDLYSPGELLRNGDGTIIGAYGLSRSGQSQMEERF